MVVPKQRRPQLLSCKFSQPKIAKNSDGAPAPQRTRVGPAPTPPRLTLVPASRAAGPPAFHWCVQRPRGGANAETLLTVTCKCGLRSGRDSRPPSGKDSFVVAEGTLLERLRRRGARTALAAATARPAGSAGGALGGSDGALAEASFPLPSATQDPLAKKHYLKEVLQGCSAGLLPRHTCAGTVRFSLVSFVRSDVEGTCHAAAGAFTQRSSQMTASQCDPCDTLPHSQKRKRARCVLPPQTQPGSCAGLTGESHAPPIRSTTKFALPRPCALCHA